MSLSFRESLLVGFSDFWSRKVRGFVTIFSVILGVMSIIVVQSLIKGVKDSTLDWMMERGGLTRIDINTNWQYDNPKNLPAYLTYKEFEFINSLIPEAEYVTPQLVQWGRVNRAGNQMWSTFGGVLPEFPLIEDWNVAEGRFITNLDLSNSNDVVVIGSTIKEELFGSRSAVGELITFRDRRLLVIGVMDRRFFRPQNSIGQDNMLEYLNRRAYVPISTMINKLSAEDRINNLTVQAKGVGQAIELREKLTDILLNLRWGEPVLLVSAAQDSADQMAEGTKVFQIVFMAISLISLLVGGIVIMNVMMASVQERTREIGIRMAVGAGRFDIFMQFIIQALLVTIIGGVMGVLVGLSLLNVVSDFIGIGMTGGTTMVVISLSISALLGLIFGIFPALKASKLDPVKCLSYE